MSPLDAHMVGHVHPVVHPRWSRIAFVVLLPLALWAPLGDPITNLGWASALLLAPALRYYLIKHRDLRAWDSWKTAWALAAISFVVHVASALWASRSGRGVDALFVAPLTLALAAWWVIDVVALWVHDRKEGEFEKLQRAALHLCLLGYFSVAVAVRAGWVGRLLAVAALVVLALAVGQLLLHRRLLPFAFAALSLAPASLVGQTVPSLVAPARGSGDAQAWFSGRQLPRPIRVEVVGVDSRERCEAVQVVFRPSEAGAPSPDTVNGQWEASGCEASTRWSLADRVGRQHLKVALASHPERRLVYEATGRQGARVFFGVAYTPRQDAHTVLMHRADTAIVQTGDTTRFLVSDSTWVRSVERRAGVFPVLGVDFPLWPSLERVRMSAAMSVREDRIFFFGFSGMQAFVFGPSAEASAIDLHLGLQLSRRDLGLSGAACGAEPFCSRSDLRVAGVTLLLTVDSASAFRGLASTVLR